MTEGCVVWWFSLWGVKAPLWAPLWTSSNFITQYFPFSFPPLFVLFTVAWLSKLFNDGHGYSFVGTEWTRTFISNTITQKDKKNKEIFLYEIPQVCLQVHRVLVSFYSIKSTVIAAHKSRRDSLSWQAISTVVHTLCFNMRVTFPATSHFPSPCLGLIVSYKAPSQRCQI